MLETILFILSGFFARSWILRVFCFFRRFRDQSRGVGSSHVCDGEELCNRHVAAFVVARYRPGSDAEHLSLRPNRDVCSPCLSPQRPDCFDACGSEWTFALHVFNYASEFSLCQDGKTFGMSEFSLI
jgi:hypothetical protein